MQPLSSTPKSSKTSNESGTDEGGGPVSEQYRDAAVMRIFLSTKLDLLKSREVAYQRQQQAPVSVGEAHADCLLLASADIDCDSLRAAYVTDAILAAEIGEEAEEKVDEKEEQKRQRRQLRETTGGLWLDYCRAVTRLYCRIEAAFLRMAAPFVSAAASGNAAVAGAEAGAEASADAEADAKADRQSRARQLWLLADAIAGLATRLGVALTSEFECCRECLRRYLAEAPRKREKSSTSSLHLTPKWSTAASTPSTVASFVTPPPTDSQQQRQQRQQQQQNQEPNVQQVSWRVLLPWKKSRRCLVVLLAVIFLGCVALLPLGWYLRSLGIFCLDWDLILDTLAWPKGVPY